MWSVCGAERSDKLGLLLVSIAIDRGTRGTGQPMTHDSSPDGVEDDAEQVEPAKIAAFAGMVGDDTGSVTFERFPWQAKLAVRAWLGTLAGDSVIAVVCEHVEDLAFIEISGFRFAQLKTRDKGSWSVAKICAEDHAVDRLVTSYLSAETAGIVHLSRFGCGWKDLRRRPKRRPNSSRIRLRPAQRPDGRSDSSGCKVPSFTIFSVGCIHCNQPARPSVDAVIIRLIGAIWPALTMHQVERLYEVYLRLLRPLRVQPRRLQASWKQCAPRKSIRRKVNSCNQLRRSP